MMMKSEIKPQCRSPSSVITENFIILTANVCKSYDVNSLDKLFALHLYSTLFVCLFISLICTICHVPYATLSIFYIIFIFFI